MPFLTLEWDVVDDHPVVNDLRRDNIPVSASPRLLREGRCSHRGVDIGVYLVDNVFCHRMIDIRVHILGNSHAPDVVNGLLRSLGLSGKKRFAVL